MYLMQLIALYLGDYMKFATFLYIFLTIGGGALLFASELGPLYQNDVVLIYFLIGMTIIINRIVIPLPTKQYLQLNSVVYLAVMILFGVSTANWVVLSTLINDYFFRKLKIWQALYNASQFLIMLFISEYVYLVSGGEVSNFNLLNPWPFFFSAIVYMVVNALMVTGIRSLRRNSPFFKNLINLFRDSASNYFMMIIYAFILTMLFKVQTYVGSVIFIVMVILMADNYKRYFLLLERMKQKANCDELTGIHNHRFFQQALKEEIEQMKPGESLSLLFIDIDYFKKFNDTYGHMAGDEILQRFTNIVLEALPTNAVFARYGGEEFVAILPGMRTQEAHREAEHLRKTVQATTLTDKSQFPHGGMTVSIGISTYPEISADREALIRNADQALYAAKRLGRNRTRVYSIKYDAPKDSSLLRTDQELHQFSNSLMAMLKAKDLETYQHSMRVCQYTLAFAEWLNLPAQERRCLEFAAMLHDIGKIEIPREILHKKEALLDYEWEWVKKHSEYGESLLKTVPELEMILPIVRHHHERYDGKGYPDGLAGKRIPYLARLLAIVDAFDAMTTKRSYKETKNFSEAIFEMRRCSGTQFDAKLLDEFLEMLSKIRQQEDSMLDHVEGI